MKFHKHHHASVPTTLQVKDDVALWPYGIVLDPATNCTTKSYGSVMAKGKHQGLVCHELFQGIDLASSLCQFDTPVTNKQT